MTSNTSLRRRSTLAAAWAGSGHVTGQLLRLAANLVLARLLMPEAFGIMSVIAALMAALYLFSDIGTSISVVQSKRGTDEDFLNTAWTLQVIRGVILWLAGSTISLLIGLGQSLHWFKEGTVYADARLPPLLAVACLATILGGLASINISLAERQMNLKRLTLIELLSQAFGAMVMVVGAWITGSIWFLVIGNLAQGVLRTSLSHAVLHGTRARLRLEGPAVRELLGTAKWILLSSVLGFIAANGDRFLLGGIIDSATMGIYSIALGLAGIVASSISMLYSKVVFPSLSEVVRSHSAELGRVYQKFQAIADIAIGTLAGFLFMMSHLIVDVLYDDRYLLAGHVFAVLCIGSLGERFRVVEQMYLALGRTSLVAYSMAPRVIVLGLGIPLGHASWGLDGALAAIVLSQFSHWPLAIWFRSTLGLNRFMRDGVLLLALGAGLGAGWCAQALLLALR
jgi:O-antigen/teichoic acid export membrane protein